MLRFGSRAFRASRSLFAEASAAKEGFLNLTFSSPNVVISDNAPVYQVIVSTTEGDMGVLANHAPTIAELKPGVVTLYNEATATPAKFFVPAGMLIVENDSSATLTASEAIPLEDFDVAKVKKSLDDAVAELAKASTEEQQVNARINLDVFTAINFALQ
jgi:F-type H+-transporting ATPase subunit delta